MVPRKCSSFLSSHSSFCLPLCSPSLQGGAAIITRSFARIHETNLKKQGTLSLCISRAYSICLGLLSCLWLLIRFNVRPNLDLDAIGNFADGAFGSHGRFLIVLSKDLFHLSKPSCYAKCFNVATFLQTAFKFSTLALPFVGCLLCRSAAADLRRPRRLRQGTLRLYFSIVET